MKIIYVEVYAVWMFTVGSSFTLRPLQDKNVIVETNNLHSQMGTNQRREHRSYPEVLRHNKELREICQS